MEEAPPPPPPAEPPPVLRTSEETDAMTLAAVHPYGHEEPLEISRKEFESFVRDGFYIEEDTLEELPLDEVVEGVNRELDLMKSFPCIKQFRELRWLAKSGPHDGATRERDQNK